MKSHTTLFSLVLYIAHFNLISPALAASPVKIVFPEKPTASRIPNVIEDHFIGVSYELSSFDTLWGKSVQAQPLAMQNYMSNLAARMSKPLRIRIGGNGMDASHYIPNLSQVLDIIDDTYFNNIPVYFGPKFIDILNGMADKVGNMTFYLGLGMQFPDEVDSISRFASDAKHKLGDRLDAFLLGNEPDLYDAHGKRPGYSISDYIPEIETLIDSLHEVGAIAGDEPAVAGPTTCCNWDILDVLNAGLDKLPYKYYTLQQYPNNNCKGLNGKNTNMTYYLTHSNVEPYLTQQKDALLRAQELNVPFILSEFNSVSCGGSNISDTFAMSMWIADAGLKAASLNYTAVFVHTREYEITYNLFDPPTPETSTQSGWRTGSPYYGALFLSEVTSPEGSIVIDLNLNNSTTSDNATVAGYGIYDDGGVTRGKLALFNFGNQPQVFVIPSGLATTITYRLLTAPDAAERTNISWAGQTVGPSGNLEGYQASIDMECNDGCRMTIPGPSAALVALDDASEKLFTGDSTARAMRGDQSGTGRVFVPFVEVALIALCCVLSLIW